MKNKKHFFLKTSVIVFVFSLVMSCSNGKVETEQNKSLDKENVEELKSTNTQDKRYEIKSGIIEYKMKLLGIESDVKSYFDNYGDLEATIATTSMNMMGMDINTKTKTILRDGWSYTIDMTQNKGTKIKLDDDNDVLNFDIRKMREGLQDEFDLIMKNSTTETFLNKKCQVIEVKDEESNSESKLWIWKNIPLKVIINTPDGSIEMIASSFNEQSVNSSMFEIPKDIEIVEIDDETFDKQMDMMEMNYDFENAE